MVTSTVVGTISVASNPISLAMHPNGNLAYVTGGLGTVTIVDLNTLSATSTISVGSGAFGASLTRSGDQLYVVNSGGNSVSVIRTSDASVVATVNVGQTPLSGGQFIGGGKLLDIDGDGEVRPTTDMVLLLRWQLGIRGAALVSNAVVSTGSARTSVAEIEAYLLQLEALGAP